MFITDGGKVFTWGDGRDGRLGLGHFKNVWHPTMVADFGNHIIDHIACGKSHTIALSGSYSNPRK